MATFKFSRAIDLHWNGYDIQGPAETVFSIPDQLYEEFNDDIAPVEPTLVWIDTNEFLTLTNAVSVTTLTGTAPIVVTATSSGKEISLNANYQTAGSYQPAGTYVTGVVGTSPISATGTTSITVSLNQSVLSVANATSAESLRTYVKNTSGSTMTKGQAVYISGADGTNVTIALSTASTEAGSSKTLGLLYQDLANNAFGWVIENGYLGTIDTSASTDGQTVWLGNTPGSLVYGAPPAEPSHSVYLGVVARSNANNGEILVKVQNGYEIDELHDVSAGSPTDLDILQYKSSSSLWTKASIANAGIAASTHTHAIVSNVIGTSPVSVSTSSGTSTISIIDASIGSAKIEDNAIVAAKIAAAAVGTSAISSGAATSGQLLQANGSGGASFATFTSGIQQTYVTLTGTGTWTVPSGVKEIELLLVSAGGGGGSGALGAILSAPTAGSGASGGGGGGGGNMIYLERFVIPSSTTSYTYSVPTGGAGGAAISYSAITGSVKTAQLLSGNSGSNSSGATTFGPDLNINASTGGGGGAVSTAGAPTAGSSGLNGTVNVPLDYVNKDNVIVRAADGAAGGTVGSPVAINSSTTYVGEEVVTYYSRFALSDLAGFDIGYGSSSTNIQASASISKTGAGAYTTSAGGRALNTTSQSGGPIGGSGGGAGAALSTTPSAGSASVSGRGANQSGCGNGAISAYFAVATVGTITASAGNGWNAVSFAQGSAGGAGGGGGSVAIYASSQANANATGYVLSSGSGGNGSNGVIIIGYKL